MADIPRVEQQNLLQALTDRKAAVAAANRRLEVALAVLKRAGALLKQSQFYRREIDSARGRVFMLTLSQLRHAEVAHADEYLAVLEEGVQELTEAEKEDP